MKILSKPKGNAEEYGRWSVNPYKGCPHDCKYCYLKEGPWAEGLGGSVPVLKEHIVSEEHAYYVAMAEIMEHREEIIRDGGLFMTFTSDPCIKETRKLFFKITEKASGEYGIPIMILTKASDFMSECHSGVYNEATQHFIWSLKKVAYGWTLTGHDELEPNAPSNESRIDAMRLARKEATYIWASIEPVITFDASYQMIQQALDAGCTHFKIGLMTKRTKVCRNGFSCCGHDFAPYDHAECLAFIQDVMVATRERATVYWKQSFRDFLGGTPKHRLFTDDELHNILDDYHNAVGKDWSIFNSTKSM